MRVIDIHVADLCVHRGGKLELHREPAPALVRGASVEGLASDGVSQRPFVGDQRCPHVVEAWRGGEHDRERTHRFGRAWRRRGGDGRERRARWVWVRRTWMVSTPTARS